MHAAYPYRKYSISYISASAPGFKVGKEQFGVRKYYYNEWNNYTNNSHGTHDL